MNNTLPVPPLRRLASVSVLLPAIAALVACAMPPNPTAASPAAVKSAPAVAPGVAPTSVPATSAMSAASATSAALTTTSVASAESTRLQTLFDSAWEAHLKRHPEDATRQGDHRYDDRLSDASPEAEAAGYAETRQQLADAKAIQRDRLSATEQVSLDLFIYEATETLRNEPLVGYRRMSLGALGGFQSGFASLLQASPAATTAQAEQVLARMNAYPHRVDQELVRLRQGQSLGWVPPRAVLERVLASLDKQIAARGDASPFFEPFTKIGPEVPATEQQRLRGLARQAIAEQVLPAQRRLRAFVAGPYLAAAPASGAMRDYPGGAAVYREAVRSNTTTDLTPAQIHAIGLREVARLQGQIQAVMREMKWQGDFASFTHWLNTDPKFFYKGPDELLAGYRDIGKRIDPELPRFFAELPRTTYGMRAIPAFQGAAAAAYYNPPPLDGTGPGWFNANTAAWRSTPRWSMETLTAHEAVPGHHLQVARAAELGQLPKFRRSAWFVAYGEGWALYAETLGTEIGLYQDPASHFGHLQAQIFRAARLVVDTGIHDMGWSRQKAIDYMVDVTGEDRAFISSEVDRYTSWPGQALGYMIGNLKLHELRDRAQNRLGDRFDLRRFHMVLLDQGAVPLPLLEARVDEWIGAEAARR